MLNSIFFKSKEEADAVNSTLNNGVVVHLRYLRLLHSIDSTPEDVFNTDTLPLIWDSNTSGWMLDDKTSGRGIINNRTVKFSLFQQPLTEGELGGWTIIFVGAKRT